MKWEEQVESGLGTSGDMSLSRRPISGLGTQQQQPGKARLPANLTPESGAGSLHPLGWGTGVGGVLQLKTEPDRVRCAPKIVIALPQPGGGMSRAGRGMRGAVRK